jgi:hypothetical protein
MTPALIISFAACSSAAILLSGMLIYHDIDSKAISRGWERAIAVFTELLQIGLLSVGLFAVAVALSGREVYWYDTVRCGSTVDIRMRQKVVVLSELQRAIIYTTR